VAVFMAQSNQWPWVRVQSGGLWCLMLVVTGLPCLVAEDGHRDGFRTVFAARW